MKIQTIIKSIAEAAAILTLTFAPYVHADPIKLYSPGTVMSETELLLDRTPRTAAMLVEVQGNVYVVEDTEIWKVWNMNLRIGDRVTVGFWLCEDDTLCKCYIADK